MFAICPNKVYKNKDLTGVDIKVYLAIQGFSNENGYCFPSIAKIADICGVCNAFRRIKIYSTSKKN